MTGHVTRDEFAMLVSRVAVGEQRFDSMDKLGTRGVGVVQQQLTDLKGDVAGLMVRMETHEKDHVAEAKERITGRRWLIGALIAFAAILETPILYIAAHIHR